MKTIVIASNNPKKIKEIEALLVDLDYHFVTALGAGFSEEIDENGASLAENALIKAKTLFNFTLQPTLADDSGLFVDVLKGEPGIHSARFAGDNASDQDNTFKLLAALNATKLNFPFKAYFKTVICYFENKQSIHFFEGVIAGNIIAEPKGTMGFGYDPIFVPDGFNLTFAEIEASVKNSISHRAKALALFSKHLREI